MAIKNVLLTGAAGYLSGFIIAALKDDYRLTLFDRAPLDTDLPFIQGDICDLDTVAQACQGQDAIVHTVALVRARAEKPVSDFADVMVKGTWHVLETCAQAGIERLVNISSIIADGSIVSSPRPLLPGDSVSYSAGDLYYCLGKKLGEVIAAAYAQAHSTNTIHLRPGVIAGDGANPGPDIDPPDINQPWFIYVDPRDVAQAVYCALKTERFCGTYNIVAGRSDSLFDWRPAAAEIGYAPQYNWPEIKQVDWQENAT
jgi:nucleoside-diphosphate-sugar epimerase